MGVADCDGSARSVALTDRARELSAYVGTVPRYGRSRSEYYAAVAAVAAVGVLLVVAAWTDVPLLGAVDPATGGTLSLPAVGVSAAVQTARQGGSLLGRRRADD